MQERRTNRLTRERLRALARLQKQLPEVFAARCDGDIPCLDIACQHCADVAGEKYPSGPWGVRR